MPQSARAYGIIAGDTIPAGEVIDNDAVVTGADVVVDGTVNGDVLAVGDTVTINGTVKGSLVAVGLTVVINGEVDGTVYTAAQTLELRPSASLSRNIYFAGFRLITRPGSRVERDLVAGSIGAELFGEVRRDLKGAFGLLELVRKLGESIDWRWGMFRLRSSSVNEPVSPASQEPVVTRRGGMLMVMHQVEQRDVSRVASTSGSLYRPQGQDEAEAHAPDSQRDVVSEQIQTRLEEFVILLIIGVLAVWLIPSVLDRWVGQVRATPLPAAGYGLVAYVTGFTGTGLVAALMLVTGLWLGFVSLWKLAFLFWGLGYSSLVLAFSAFALVVFYGSKVIVADLAGTLILERLAPRAAKYKLLPLVLGLVLYVLLRSIPALGWVIGVIVTLLGLGAVWLARYHLHHPERLNEPQSTTPGEAQSE
jgi:cytoskeletal protein CcmA (bactofilin family)